MNTLGIGTQIYNKEMEEQAQIDKAEQTKIEKERREIVRRRRCDKQMYNARFKQQQRAYRKAGKK